MTVHKNPEQGVIAGVNDTAEKVFIDGVNDAGVKFIAS
jgi:hypothetical protein